MAERVRAHDWTASGLGPVGSWPQSLRTAVDLCLGCKLPMFVWWGSRLINIYNDAYAEVLGKRHPAALGQPAREIWGEIWAQIDGDVAQVMERGEAVVQERVHLLLERNGYPEDTWFNYSYSPIRDEHGAIAGLFQVCTDETARVLAEQARDRLAAQRQLALDAAEMGWWQVDLRSRVATFDHRYTQIVGISQQLETFDEVYRHIHPDDLERVRQVVRTSLDPLQPRPFTVQHRIVRSDGQIRWVEEHGLALFEGDGLARRAISLLGTMSDITERLAEEDQARTILESITDAFYAVDRGWRFTYVNGRAAQEARVDPKELLGRSIWEVFPGLRGHSLERLYRRAMDERVAGAETSFYPDFQRWYEVHVYPAKAGGISIYFRDVTERMSEAEALRQSTSLLRGISDSTGDVIYAKDREGRLRFANPATLALIGKPLGEVLGRTDAELLGDEQAAQAVMENDRQIMERGVAADLEERVPLPDGTERIWLSRKMPNRGADGAVTGLLGVSRDITEQKRAWDRVNRLYAVAAALAEAVTPEDVVRVTIDHCIAAVGAAAGSLALLTPDGASLELAGSVGFTEPSVRTWSRFPPSAPIPLAEAVRTGQPVFIESPQERLGRYPALATLNSNRGTHASASLPLTIGGRTVGALGLSFDRAGEFSGPDREFMISLGRQCAQALERARLFDGERRARAEAERASSTKDEFLATLSHELRTPLNAILGWATVLSRRLPAGSDLHNGLEKIQRNAQAQTRIVEDLLDMSRIISGNLRLEVQRLDLTQVLQAALDTVRPAADAKGIRLRAVLDSQGGPVSGDPSRLQQVFWNLLHNAVKFTGKGGQVQVTLERVHSHVELHVADTGEGIPAAFLPHVFDRFRQADASTTRRHGGLGLGLAIVKQLVELHGGSIRAASAGVGLGATFTVELPLAVLHTDATGAAGPSVAPAGAMPPLASDEPPQLTGMRVLVVDDEADARALVKHLLEERGALVQLAGSAAEALELLALGKPDVLVSDIGMPLEDGYALIRRVRALAPGEGGSTPAVALTAYARTEDRVRAIRAGFHSHIVKPVEPSELIAVVASLAGRGG